MMVVLEATLVYKYSVDKVDITTLQLRVIIVLNKILKIEIFWGHEVVFVVVKKFIFLKY